MPTRIGRSLKGVTKCWVTRRNIRVNRTATIWLIRRFIDPQAVFLFADPSEVAAIQQREGAKGFDAPGALYPHKDAKGRCSFEARSIVPMMLPFANWPASSVVPTFLKKSD